jgi:hypothetical protein
MQNRFRDGGVRSLNNSTAGVVLFNSIDKNHLEGTGTHPAKHFGAGIDILQGTGGIHTAVSIPAVNQTKQMSHLVNSFLPAAGKE